MSQTNERTPSGNAAVAEIKKIARWFTGAVQGLRSKMNWNAGRPTKPRGGSLRVGSPVGVVGPRGGSLRVGSPVGVVRPLAPDLARTDGTGGVPDFAYHGGPVINTPKVCVLFIGDWKSEENQNRAKRLREFTIDLLNSVYMNVLSQYGCGTTGTVAEPAFIAAKVERRDNELSAGEIRGILQDAIANDTIPEPDRRTVYMLFLDDRIRVNDKVAGAVMCAPESDTAFGYHHFFITKDGTPCYFAVIPGLTEDCLRRSCPGDDAGCSLHLAPEQTQEERQTQVASHELAEVLTNPKVGIHEAWTALGGQENGDICNGQAGKITVGNNTWTVQLVYSKWHDMDTNGKTTCIAEWPAPLPSLIDIPAGAASDAVGGGDVSSGNAVTVR